MNPAAQHLVTRSQIRSLIPNVRGETLERLSALQLTTTDIAVVKEVVEEHKVKVGTVVRIMELGLAAQEMQAVVAFQRERADLPGVTLTAASRLFAMCDGAEEVMDRFIDLASPYITEAEGARQYRRMAFLIHCAETMFDNDLGAISEFLNQHDPDEINDVLSGRKVPTDEITKEALNRFFEGGSDDFDREEM